MLPKFLLVIVFFGLSSFTYNTKTINNDYSEFTEISNSIIKLVNQIRTEGCQCGDTYYPPVNPLTYNYLLEDAALNLSKDMDKNNFFNHLDSKGQNVTNRLNNVGYKWLACAENIAKNQETPEAVVKAWINSPKHCKNLMNQDFDEMGVAKIGPYWTQVFGTK